MLVSMDGIAKIPIFWYFGVLSSTRFWSTIMSNLTFGSDPEFMLQKGGRFFSAIPLIPGNKHQRHAIGKHHAYYDNVMAECAVYPADNKKQFIINLRDCLQRFASLVKPYKLIAQASANYPAEELRSDESQQIGCDPEFCAYSMTIATAPEEEFRSGTLRTAGGHIHLGTPVAAENAYGCLFVIRMLDLFLGTASIFLDKDKTTKRRKELYGKAGRFRQPKWGAEYRSLSNFWLTSPKLTKLVLDLCDFTVDFVGEKQHEKLWTVDYDRLNDEKTWEDPNFNVSQCHHCVGYNVDDLRAAIDNANKRKGAEFLEFIYKFLPSKLHKRIIEMSACGPYDMYEEWGIK